MADGNVHFGTTLPIALVLLLLAGTAPARSYTWQGNGTDNRWETDSNWSPATGHPANGDDLAQFKSDAEVVLETGKTIGSLSVGAAPEATECEVRLAAATGSAPLALSKGLYLGSASGKSLAGNLYLDAIGLRVGSPDAPADFQVGYSGWGREWIRSRLVQRGGSFEGWVDDLYVGHFGGTGNIRTNVVDFSQVDGGKLRISGLASIGVGQTARHTDLRFGDGWEIRLGSAQAPVPFTFLSSSSTPGDKEVRWEQEPGLFSGHLTTFSIATATVSGPRAYHSGTMRFGAETKIDAVVSNLVMASGNDLSLTGRLDAASTTGGSLTVLTDLTLAAQANGQYRRAELLLGTNWTIRIGSPDKPDEARFTMAQVAMDKAETQYESIFRTAHGGTFEAYCTNLHVAGSPSNARYNRSASLVLPGLDLLRIRARGINVGELTRSTSTACSSTGLLDAGDAQEVDIEAQTLRIGCLTYPNAYRFGGEGIVRLGAGTATIGDLAIRNGDRTDQPTGSLELNGTRVTTTNSFLVGKNGTVQVRVLGQSAGIELSGPAGEAPRLAGKLEIAFDAPPSGFALTSAENSNDVYWGLKWSGDHVASVEDWASSGKISWTTGGLPAKMAEAVAIFHDTTRDTTYLGFPVRIVRPGTVLILR